MSFNSIKINNFDTKYTHSIFDISEYTGNQYPDLSSALTDVPTEKQSGGMTVEFIQHIPATYTVIKIEGITEQPTGIEVQEELLLVTGTYNENEIEAAGVEAPTSSATYYLAVTVDETTTYTKWVIIKATNDVQKYVQYRLMSDTFNTNVANWQGVDDEPIAGSDNLVKSGGVFPTINAVNKSLIPINGKVSIIGDSISTYAGTLLPDYVTYYPKSSLGVLSVYDTWWHTILSLTNSELEVNASWSGSRVTDGRSGDGMPDFYDRTNILGSPDYIFVELGTNDSSASVALGDYDYDSENLSESEFIPAYIKGIKALKINYPEAKIILFICFMNDLYATAIKNIGKHYNIDTIDVRFYAIDGKHPNKLGMCKIAQTICSFYIKGIVDDVPIVDSNNLVKSGGVNQVLNDAVYSIEEQISKKEFTFIGNNGAVQTKIYEITGTKRIRIVPITKQWSIANISNGSSYIWINVGDRQILSLKKANDATITNVLSDYYEIVPLDTDTQITINIRADRDENVLFAVLDNNYSVIDDILSLKNRQDSTENDLNFVSLNLSAEDLEQGNIKYNDNGTITYNTTNRIRLKQGKTVYIPKDTLIYFPKNIISRYYVFWKETGSNIWSVSDNWISNSYFVTVASGEYTFIFDTPYTEEDASKVAMFFIAQKNVTIDNIKSIQNEQSFGNVTYYGRRICLNKRAETHKAYIEKLIEVEYGSDGVNPLVATQSSAVYNNLMFVFLDTSISWSGGILCKIFSLTNKNLVADILNNGTIPSAHCNGAVFSNIFYDAEDDFPLLLLSSGSSSADNWLKICRITTTETEGVTVYNINVVKTITYDTNTLTHTHYMTSAIDEVNDCLWVYGYNTSETSATYAQCWFYKFPLPNFKDNIDITLTNDDVINVLKYPYRVAGQAFQVYKGRAYMAGLDQGKFPDLPRVNPARNVTVVNLSNGEIENMVPSIDEAETEGISVYNGALYVSSRRGGTSHEALDVIFHITKWTFEQQIPSP